ncbi:DsbA family protein [Streptomyces alkaliterrae]|uniref:DsbA family protein n=1 Tax=Streptomyces alkaliterrae TaxID=2213162 RepID=A0A5P0YMY9_9ACTN|nr:thioredoxin domain-containing protein [Streptomyces alkaliterrae]MBB1256329.1 DsbA family protein [Streptomyces alkaliterrae]MBB1262172.1 DsbA family protein [Streptomyces alkaliterrae]MQS01703.1 thioredoxin domain-containing protein [Streptomyces alkaliterrae]
MSKKSAKATGPQKLTAVVLVAVLAVAAVLASVSAFGRPDSPPSAEAGNGTSAAGDQRSPDADLLALARREKGDPYALGRADAPVVMIEYSDFQCPYCGRFARETKPELVKKYVDTGVLRIEWRQFPIFGAESDRVARASYAAGQQGRFWEFHDLVFAEERPKNSGAFVQRKLEEMAERAGVKDLAAFRSDMRGPDATAAVGADRNEGQALGVSSTPAFLINGTPVLGAQSAEYFGKAIEQARARAEAAR